jgi:hypothetical protein
MQTFVNQGRKKFFSIWPWSRLAEPVANDSRFVQMLEDIDYIGFRHNRVTGQAYDEFIDEFMEAVVRRYGQVSKL